MPEHQQIKQSKKPDTIFQKPATPVNQTPVSNPYSIIQRARINPKSFTHADIMQLQRTIGNREVGRLLSGIGNTSTAQQASAQRQEIPEEEEICPSCVQRREIPEEEPFQTKRENNTGMPDNVSYRQLISTPSPHAVIQRAKREDLAMKQPVYFPNKTVVNGWSIEPSTKGIILNVQEKDYIDIKITTGQFEGKNLKVNPSSIEAEYVNTGLKTGERDGEDPKAVEEVIKDWESYAERAFVHLEQKKDSYKDKEEYEFKKKQLASSVKLAGIFRNKFSMENHKNDFVITKREGKISALMICKQRGKSAFIDDLMVNPRKLYSIAPEDKIQGRDESPSAAVEQVMREVYSKGGEVKLLGGDTTARSYWWKMGFGVMIKKKQGYGQEWTHDENECVKVNPKEGNTERDMIMPNDKVNDKVKEYFQDPKRFKQLLGQAPEGIALI